MSNYIYNQLEREYEIKRKQAESIVTFRKKKIYEENSDLQKLEEEKNIIALKITRNILLSDTITRQVEEENMNKKLSEIEKKIENILNKLGISKDFFEPQYECKICKDTGKIIENGMEKYCNCFTQRVINESYKQYNMLRLKEENFGTFDTCYYSSKTDKEKYGMTKSPLQNIENIKKISEIFIEKIDDNEQKNLLFVGNTGLGKTFIANCIANELIKAGKTVIYQTAPLLMDSIMEYKFNFDKKSSNKDNYQRLFDVDLLIIDDLGTETMSNNKFTELFNIINTRLLENRKIIISTNLNLQELYSVYDERVVSRILGGFIACKFIGDDIRIKRKRIPSSGI